MAELTGFERACRQRTRRALGQVGMAMTPATPADIRTTRSGMRAPTGAAWVIGRTRARTVIRESDASRGLNVIVHLMSYEWCALPRHARSAAMVLTH
jgi:hypothetical protein